MENFSLMRRAMRLVIAGGCAVGTLLIARDARADSAAKEAYFETHIRPLLIQNCIECHDDDYTENGLRLDSREAMLTGGDHGAAIAPGDAANSLLLKMVRGEGPGMRQMPFKADPLAEEEIAHLEKWIADGAVWPATADTTLTRADVDHWAYRSLAEVTLPEVAEKEWAEHAIDRFVKGALDEQGLAPAPEAEGLVLARRLKFNLIGLPLTPEEVVEFSGELEAGWYDALVERYLASPHYGERWGRHWLDVVRYADANGSVADMPLDEAWRYRNFVIAAFNNDMAYDQFLQEQLAGDLLNEEEGLPNPLRGSPRYVDRPPVNPENHIGMLPHPTKVERTGALPDEPLTEEQRRRYIATGYLALSRRHGTEHSLYPHHLTIDDTVDNLGRTVLGLTYGCARCHDHKFDEISSEDYYGLYGIFASTRLTWCGVELAPHPRDMIPLIPQAEYAAMKKEVAKATGPQRGKVFHLWEKWLEAWENEKANPDDTDAARLQLDRRTALWSASKREGRARIEAMPEFEKAYGAVDSDSIGDAPILEKGDPDRRGEIVPRSFPRALGGGPIPAEMLDESSGRLALARWLTDGETPAGALTARVMVNRIWQHHFGSGFMNDPNDFGVRGGAPSHPELLDLLARRFIESGWSVKSLHREILATRTYRASTQPSEANQEQDPVNRYLWRQNRRRLDAETLRDSVLYVSGKLDLTPMEGPHPFHPVANRTEYTQHSPFQETFDHQKRSIYLMMKRMKKHPFFAVFDGPDRAHSTGSRDESVSTPQALFMLNNPMIHAASESLAADVIAAEDDTSTRVSSLYRELLGRAPELSEVESARLLLDSIDGSELETWASLCRAMFRTNEFLYIN